MKKLILLSILLIVGCEEPTIEGCMTDTACNYNIDATKDDGICLENDCNGECGGSTVEDDCGVCDSDATNDCTTDCHGVWGGTYSINDCDYCLPEYASNYNCDDLNVINAFKSHSSIASEENVIIDFGNQIWSEGSDRLISLEIRNLQISGAIPQNISDLTYLEELFLTNNSFSGSIPENIGDLSKLKVLTIGNNQLTGEIPTSLYNLSNLEELWLWGNQLSGQLSDDIVNLNKLKILDLSENHFSGTIPENICEELLLIMWKSYWDGVYTNRGFLYDNNFCPEYPWCIEDHIGYQDTSNCP